MAGVNPYIDPAKFQKPEKAFRITFINEESGEKAEVEVDPAAIPYGETGLPGSVLDIALGAGIEIDHACGGVCACSTCHVVVREGYDSCNESSDDEEDQLDNAPGVGPRSRLACQCVPDGEADLVVEVPEWNRNAVREPHH